MTSKREIYFALHHVLVLFDQQNFEDGMELLHGVHDSLQEECLLEQRAEVAEIMGEHVVRM